MFKLICSILLFFGLSTICSSQNSANSNNFEDTSIGSVKKADLLESHFQLVLKHYAQLSDSTELLALNGIELSRNQNSLDYEALFHNALGMFYLQKSKYSSSIRHNLSALRIREKLNLEKDIATSMNNLGLVYQKIGNFEQSINYFNDALRINKNLKNEEGIALNLGNLSIVYSEQKNFKKAIFYAKESLSKKQKLNEASAKLNELKAKKESAQEQSKEKYEEMMSKLEKQREEMKSKYEKMKNSAEDQWEEVDKAFSKASESFKEGAKEIASIF